MIGHFKAEMLHIMSLNQESLKVSIKLLLITENHNLAGCFKTSKVLYRLKTLAETDQLVIPH